MPISRRQFNRSILVGGTATAVSSTYSFFFPKPAEAYESTISLGNLSSQAFYQGLRRYAATKEQKGVLSSVLSNRPTDLDQTAPGSSDVIRQADATLRSRDFNQNPTELAEAGYASVSRLWARQKQENVGTNVGSCFIQNYEGDYYTSKLAGPFTAAIYRTLPILFEDAKIKQPELVKILLPIRSLKDDNSKDDLSSWFGINGQAYTVWETAAGNVQCDYQLKKSGPSGFGEIKVSMEAEDHPARNLRIRINFIRFFS
jgi:hypothetical protein